MSLYFATAEPAFSPIQLNQYLPAPVMWQVVSWAL